MDGGIRVPFFRVLGDAARPLSGVKEEISVDEIDSVVCWIGVLRHRVIQNLVKVYV